MIKTNPSARAAILLALTVLFLASGAHGQSLPYAWGWGFHGEMGNNTTSYAYPVPVAVNVSGVLNGKSIAAMAAGNSHSMALCSDGTLAAWGAGNQGQIGTGQVGNNTTPPTLVPVLVNTSASSALFGKTVTAISAGGQFSLALCSDGTVAAWGWNFQGELGDGSTVQRDLPVAVQKTGTALAGKTVVAISAGDLHSIALCSDGTLVAWGSGSAGQLGNNSMADSSIAVPVTIVGTPLAGRTIASIAAGGDHNVVLCTDGTVVTWGQNLDGELGNNSTAQSLVPTAITTAGTPLASRTVVAIAVGGSHTLALCSDGSMVAWGYNLRGQLGNNGTSTSLKATAVTTAGTPLAGKTITTIRAGSSHSMALCSDGTLAAWGWNFHGEIGDNGDTQNFSPGVSRLLPSAVLTTDYVTAVFSGPSAYHNLALLSECPPATLNIAQYSGITVTGKIGCTYQIQYTTSLNPPVTWTPLTTITLTATSYLYVDTSVPAGTRFYRAIVQ